MAQFVEWSLPTTEIRGSNPDIDKLYLLSTVLKCAEKTKKMPGMADFYTFKLKRRGPFKKAKPNLNLNGS